MTNFFLVQLFLQDFFQRWASEWSFISRACGRKACNSPELCITPKSCSYILLLKAWLTLNFHLYLAVPLGSFLFSLFLMAFSSLFLFRTSFLNSIYFFLIYFSWYYQVRSAFFFLISILFRRQSIKIFLFHYFRCSYVLISVIKQMSFYVWLRIFKNYFSYPIWYCPKLAFY